MPRGIPHSVFLGRVVRPGRDPQWTDADRGYALAWQANDGATCKTCGTRHDEWAEDREAYVPDTHYCRGDELLALQHEALPKDKDGRTKPGFRAYLKPRALFEREMAAELAAMNQTTAD